ncbi:g11878 [Coccomyxa elongata]
MNESFQKDEEHDKEGLAKRIVHKLHRKHDKDGSDDANPLHDGPDPHPRHPKVEGYVTSGIHAGFAEALDALNQQEVVDTISRVVRTQAIVGVTAALDIGLSILGGKKGIDVVGKLVASQANVLAKASLNDTGRQGAREGAMEAVVGSYDAIEKKYLEWLGNNRVVLGMLCGAAGAFLLTLFLCMWRFLLFGFGPVSF